MPLSKNKNKKKKWELDLFILSLVVALAGTIAISAANSGLNKLLLNVTNLVKVASCTTIESGGSPGVRIINVKKETHDLINRCLGGREFKYTCRSSEAYQRTIEQCAFAQVPHEDDPEVPDAPPPETPPTIESPDLIVSSIVFEHYNVSTNMIGGSANIQNIGSGVFSSEEMVVVVIDALDQDNNVLHSETKGISSAPLETNHASGFLWGGNIEGATTIRMRVEAGYAAGELIDGNQSNNETITVLNLDQFNPDIATTSFVFNKSGSAYIGMLYFSNIGATPTTTGFDVRFSLYDSANNVINLVTGDIQEIRCDNASCDSRVANGSLYVSYPNVIEPEHTAVIRGRISGSFLLANHLGRIETEIDVDSTGTHELTELTRNNNTLSHTVLTPAPETGLPDLRFQAAVLGNYDSAKSLLEVDTKVENIGDGVASFSGGLKLSWIAYDSKGTEISPSDANVALFTADKIINHQAVLDRGFTFNPTGVSKIKITVEAQEWAKGISETSTTNNSIDLPIDLSAIK